jgi:hypothetical protein
MVRRLGKECGGVFADGIHFRYQGRPGALAADAAELEPELFSVDLLLIENARPRLMLVCSLLGGMSMSLVVGLLGRVRRACGLRLLKARD